MEYGSISLTVSAEMQESVELEEPKESREEMHRLLVREPAAHAQESFLLNCLFTWLQNAIYLCSVLWPALTVWEATITSHNYFSGVCDNLAPSNVSGPFSCAPFPWQLVWPLLAGCHELRLCS